jgi:ABC-type dipeptide/oligopeptide/nickel transport system permease component
LVLLQILEYTVRTGILPTSGASPVSTLISVILPITLIVLVLTGSTRRWLDEGRRR